MAKAYLINSHTKMIDTVEVNGLSDLQKYVEGDIELAVSFMNGDTLYVNEEGMRKYRTGFTINGGHQPFYGPGLLVGREIEDANFGDGARTNDPAVSLMEVMVAVSFGRFG